MAHAEALQFKRVGTAVKLMYGGDTLKHNLFLLAGYSVVGVDSLAVERTWEVAVVWCWMSDDCKH